MTNGITCGAALAESLYKTCQTNTQFNFAKITSDNKLNNQQLKYQFKREWNIDEFDIGQKYINLSMIRF